MACRVHRHTMQHSGCLTNHENKIPVDFQEFPVVILGKYFNTIYTLDAIVTGTVTSTSIIASYQLQLML